MASTEILILILLMLLILFLLLIFLLILLFFQDRSRQSKIGASLALSEEGSLQYRRLHAAKGVALTGRQVVEDDGGRTE